MRAARFDMSKDLLSELMNLPASARIIGIDLGSPISETVTFVVDDPSLPESDEVHDCQPTSRRIEWNWNVE